MIHVNAKQVARPGWKLRLKFDDGKGRLHKGRGAALHGRLHHRQHTTCPSPWRRVAKINIITAKDAVQIAAVAGQE